MFYFINNVMTEEAVHDIGALSLGFIDSASYVGLVGLVPRVMGVTGKPTNHLALAKVFRHTTRTLNCIFAQGEGKPSYDSCTALSASAVGTTQYSICALSRVSL